MSCTIKYNAPKNDSQLATRNFLVAKTIIDKFNKILDFTKWSNEAGRLNKIAKDTYNLPENILSSEQQGKVAYFNKPMFDEIDRQKTTIQQPIKEGVKKLFESNPELANSVYETLGFSNIFQNKILNGFHWYDYEGNTYSKEDFDKEIAKQDSLKPNNVVKIEYKQSDTPAGDMFNVFYVDKNKASKILAKYNVNKSVEDFIKESQDKVFNGNEKLAIDELYGEQQITPQQKQKAIELYSQYLDQIFPDSKVAEIDNSLYISVLNQLEQENKIEKDCTGGGKIKAEKGLQTNFTKGGKWKIYEIFEGKSHKQGGIDINIKNNQISFTNKNGSIKAKYGLVISKDN